MGSKTSLERAQIRKTLRDRQLFMRCLKIMLYNTRPLIAIYQGINIT